MVLATAVLAVVYTAASDLDDFGIPVAKISGRQQTVFDWSRDTCGQFDYPDSPARAFRDDQGRVRLFASHFINRSLVGDNLGDVRPDCRVVMSSTLDPNPAKFNDKEWITSTYTRDGKTVFALVHEEYQGHTHPGRCASGIYERCWYNSITAAVSHDGGATFVQPRAPAQLVASIPYRYQPDVGPYGIFQPSNTVLKDGYFYALVRAARFGDQLYGSCLIRTKSLGRPGSWRAWDGHGFGADLSDPYRGSTSTVGRLCQPVSPDRIQAMTESLTYSTYFDRFLLVGVAAGGNNRGHVPVRGFYYALSKDLIHWTERRLLAAVELPWTYRCGDRNPVLHSSVIDPDSRTRNFVTVDQRAYLYFVRYKYRNCAQTPDRDLVRVPIEFSK